MIEPMQLQDVPAVAALDAEAFAGHAWSSEAWAQEVRSVRADERRYLVMRDGGVLVGYAGIMRAGSDADVLTVAVAADHRGRGFGRALVDALLQIAAAWRCLAVFLEVEQDNQAAVGLYQALGFTKIGQRRHYYGRDRHAVTMRRQLREPIGSQPLGGGG